MRCAWRITAHPLGCMYPHLLTPRSMPHAEARRISTEPYSPECLERLSGKCSAGVMVAYALHYGEQEIPYGSVRRRMALHRCASSRTHRARTPQASRLTGDPRRRFLRAQERLPVAAFAPGLPALDDCIHDWFRRWRIDG